MEIRTLEESPEELSRFINQTWRDDYAGRMTFPCWSADYLDWQLQMSSGASRRYLLAAYENNRLVGVLPGLPQTYRVDGVPRAGLLSSWLSISPQARGRKLVPQLKQVQAERVREGGGELILSYRYHGTSHSLADLPERCQTTRDVRRRRLWVRALDPARAAGWSLSRAERGLARVGRPFLRSLQPRPSSLTVREVAEDDVDPCLQLIREELSDARLAIDWSPDLLRHHLLGASAASGLVACRGTQVAGLMGFHLLPFLARSEELVAIIDLLHVDRLSHAERLTFLASGLADMKAAGAMLAMTMNLNHVSPTTLLSSSFLPRRRDSLQVLEWMTPEAATGLHGKQGLLWR